MAEHKSITLDLYSYDEFDLFCKKFIDNADSIGYDIETNALDTHSKDYEVVGFSLASSSDYGCYVTLNSIDFRMPTEDHKLIEDRLRDILLHHKTIVYNCMHELPATLNWLDIEIPDFDDLLIMVKLMMGTATVYTGKGGLKPQSMMHLGVDDWSKDLDDYADAVKTYKKNRDDSEKELDRILSKYYDGDSLEVIKNKVIYYATDIIPNAEEFSYGFVPCKLIARYGGIDSAILFDLKDFYENWMVEMGKELDIDLFTGYKYWKWHHYAGYCLERNGAFWNDEKAKKVEDWCEQGKADTLRAMITSPLMRGYIESTATEKYEKYIYENYCDKLIDSKKFTIKRKYSKSIGVVPNTDGAEWELKHMSIYPNKQGIYKLEMGHLIHMGKKFIESSNEIYSEWIEKYIAEVTSEDRTFDELKEILNPNSSNKDFRDYVSNFLITPMIRSAKMYDSIVKMVENPEFSFEDYIATNSEIATNVDDCRLVSLVYKLNISDIDKSERFDKFREFMDSGVTLNTGKLRWIKKDAIENYHFESMDAGTFNTVYELYLMCHIDVEDRSTWTPEFEWMFNYKMFKKFAKLKSTYIDGATGRKNVYEVDAESYGNGDILTRREKHYNADCPKSDNKMYALQTSFKVNMADTGRWTAGIHNLPASDAIKGIFTSRFKGGCIAMPDGSQMEVRTLSAESKDEALLKAFADGIDIHRFFASKIYSVPYDDVQKWQRGLAKNAVFGMLYGESEQTFANSYLGGDLSKAQEVYNGLFTGFPRIKDYIDRKHNQYETLKKVTTMTQRFINLENSRDDPSRLLRQSQNYPIQASAEDIAGVILYKLCMWLKENNMKSKPFCFIHDSIEIDMHPDEVFQILDKLNWLFNVFPREEFGVPVACDVPLSMSMGAEIEMVEMTHDDNFNDINIVLHGFEDDITELIDNWKTVYAVVEEDKGYEPSEKDKLVYMPISERFLPKKAPISMKQGTSRNSIERKFHIVRNLESDKCIDENNGDKYIYELFEKFKNREVKAKDIFDIREIDKKMRMNL